MDDLKTMDFSKIFAEHDETLLYIFYSMGEEIRDKSSKELVRKGWKFDPECQSWTTEREVSPKGNRANG